MLTYSRPLCHAQVTNGFDAAYNFVRGSPKVDLTNARVGELADATLAVSLFTRPVRWCPWYSVCVPVCARLVSRCVCIAETNGTARRTL